MIYNMVTHLIDGMWLVTISGDSLYRSRCMGDGEKSLDSSDGKEVRKHLLTRHKAVQVMPNTFLRCIRLCRRRLAE